MIPVRMLYYSEPLKDPIVYHLSMHIERFPSNIYVMVILIVLADLYHLSTLCDSIFPCSNGRKAADKELFYN